MREDEKKDKEDKQEMVQFVLHGSNPVEERAAYMSMSIEHYEKVFPEPLRKAWAEGRSIYDVIGDLDLTGNPKVIKGWWNALPDVESYRELAFVGSLVEYGALQGKCRQEAEQQKSEEEAQSSGVCE